MPYYYDLDYFPVPEEYIKTYTTEKVTSEQRPSITKTIFEGVYEVTDSYNFYTNVVGPYNVVTYKFKMSPDIEIVLTKYRPVNTAEYSICVKSNKLITGVNSVKPGFNTDILHPKTFDAIEYFMIDNPKFLVKKDGLTVDIISRENKLYACLKQYATEIGELDSAFNIFLKGELVKDTIYIFDAYIFGDILDLPYDERMKAIDLSKLGLSNKYKVQLSTIHNNFKNAFDEGETLSNDGIIIQPPYGEPLKWKPNTNNTVDFLVDGDLYVRKGLNHLINFKAVTNTKFNRRLITDYIDRYNGEIIELGIDGSFHKNRLDKNKPNAIGTYVSCLNPKNTIPVSIMLGQAREVIEYISTSVLEKLLYKYMHGKILETQVDCIALKQISNIISESNILMLQDLSLNKSCVISNRIVRGLFEYLEDEKITEKYDTFIIVNQKNLDIERLLKSAAAKSSECAHIIVFANVPVPNLTDNKSFKLTETISLSAEPYKQLVSSEMQDYLNLNAMVFSKVTQHKPLFVFVVGLMGSGKSRFIHNIRNYIHPPSALNIMSIDDEVNKFISFHLHNTPTMYGEIRKKIDADIDARIQNWIKIGQSIVLETTKITPEYVNELKKTHKVIVITCNVSLDTLKDNIARRNVHNIRKTTSSKESYDEFQILKKNYISLADEAYDFSMETGNFVQIT